VICGNPDEHPSLSPEHCTLTPNVKLAISNVSIFSIGRGAGRSIEANVPHCGVKVFIRCREQNVLHRGAKID
jgi:hypothetical protein